MSEIPKIIFRPRTPEEDARSREDTERKNRLIESEYDKAAGEIIKKIPERLCDADKLAALYGLFLDKMTYDFDWSKSVNEDGTVNRPADPSGDKYDHIVEGEHFHIDGEKLAILKNTGVCEHFAKAFADIASKLGVPCDVVKGRTKGVQSIDGNSVELGHAWNQVLIDGEVKNIDVTYGLFVADSEVKQEKGIAPELTAANFFLIDSEELRRIGPHHNFEDSLG